MLSSQNKLTCCSSRANLLKSILDVAFAFYLLQCRMGTMGRSLWCLLPHFQALQKRFCEDFLTLLSFRLMSGEGEITWEEGKTRLAEQKKLTVHRVKTDLRRCEEDLGLAVHLCWVKENRKSGRLRLDKESGVGDGVKNTWRGGEKLTVCRARRGNWDWFGRKTVCGEE